MKKYLYGIIITTTIIIIPVIIFIILPKKSVTDFDDSAIWCKQVEKFYESAAKKILDLTENSEGSIIKFLPEENNTGYLCASPCNEGLVHQLIKMLRGKTLVSEILYIDSPIFPNKITGRMVSWLGAKWSLISEFGAKWSLISDETSKRLTSTSKRLTNKWKRKLFWDLRKMSASDEQEKQKLIYKFKAESNENKRNILIVDVITDTTKVWTIAMFNGKGEFINKELINDANNELAIELNKEKSVKSRVIKLATSYLGVIRKTIKVRIGINDISINKNSKSFQATFMFFSNNKMLFKEQYEGKTPQMRWFLRQNYPAICLITIAGLCIIWIILYFFLQNIPTQYGGCESEGAKLGSGIIFVGLISSFILLFCNPMQREEANYSISTNVFFIIDRNNEIFFEQSNNNQHRVAPPYVIRRTCENIKKLLSKPKAQENVSFFTWVTNYSLESMYKKEKYMLNRERQYPVYTFSGLKENGKLSKEITFRENLRMPLLVSATQNDNMIRESRLIIPQIELESHISRKKNNFVCLFTSASAACEEDVNEYCNNVSKFLAYKKTSNLFVFTVVIPTIPRTGSNRIYNFEDGKTALASLVSDKLVLLNNVKYDVKEIIKLIEQKLEKTFRIDPETIYPTPESAKLYKINDIGFDYGSKWDQPQDLSKIRSEMLLLDKETAEKGSEFVADAFAKFVEDIDKENLKRKHSTVHVLKNEPFGHWFVLILCSLFGFSLFTRTKNQVYRNYVTDEKVINYYDFAEPLIAFIFALLGLFILQWRCIDPLLWAFFGDMDYTFIAGFSSWFCIFCAPFIVLRIWNRGASLSRAKLFGFIASFVGLCLILGFYFYYQPKWVSEGLYLRTFSGTIFLTFIPLLILPILLIWYPKSELKDIEEGIFSWWRRPWWTLILKFIFMFCFLIVIRGAFHADPFYFLSYSTGVLIYLPIILSIIGITLFLSDEKPWLPLGFAGVTIGCVVLILTLT